MPEVKFLIADNSPSEFSIPNGPAILAILTLLTLCLFPKCLASSDSDGQQITEQGRADAVVGRDTAFLYKITAEDSVRILPSGALETKSQLLAQLNSGSVTYNSIVVDQVSVKLIAIPLW